MHKAQTQPGLPALASGEAELRGMSKAATEAMYLKQVFEEFGFKAEADLLGDATAAFESCMTLTSGACPIGFAIVAIDPETMETEELYANQGPPMGGGTVGLVIGDELFVGSFAGDRVLRISLD